MEKYRGYKIEQTEHGFRITLDDGSDRHTHISSKHFCKKLIDYVADKKVPTRVSPYILESCIRLSTNKDYIQKVSELLDVKRSKSRQFYYNPHKKYF